MKHSCPPRSGSRLVVGIIVALGLSLSFALVNVAAQGQSVPVPIPGKNVNMVSGTNFPGGDPFLQRQNEPSIAVSTRNPLHMFGGANDYRTVDIPGLGDEVTGDAWLGVFKSFDGGVTWQSTLLPGFPQDPSPQGHQSPLFGLAAAADPVVRAGTNGLFYMSGIAFNRSGPADGKIFVARYIDNNNLEKGDSIQYLSTKVIDTGNPVRFIDKPWIATDIPRAGAPTCTVPGQPKPIPAGTVYVVYSVFIQKNQNWDAAKEKQDDPDWPGGGGHKEMENGENHEPGKPMEGRTQIMIARSTDCGASFSNPSVISDNQTINQGSIVAVDPVTGAVYVAWRVFKSSAEVDSIMVAKSTDGGQHFGNPVRVANIAPFDQKGTTTTFRTNSYPAMAIDGSGRVYIAWAQRGIGPASPGQPGDARIVVSSSAAGSTWSAPTPAMSSVDPYDTVKNPLKRGHQFMPVMSFGGGKLHLVFWDQRDDVAGKDYFSQYIDDYAAVTYSGPPQSPNKPKRHTIDLRAAAAYPGATLTWGPSAKISNYLQGVQAGKTVSEQLQFNAPNLPLFGLGTRPFIGDYLDVTVSPTFISNGNGTWRFNTLPSDPAVYYTAWGDNRDVRKPAARTPAGQEDWVHYTPPQFAGYTGTSIFDPTQPVAVCEIGNAGMRDQNVYSTRVSTGLLLTTLGTQKPLGYVTVNGQQKLIQRSFVVTVTNPDPLPLTKSLVLHITQQPPGGHASFLQFEQKVDLPVQVAAKSSISREVFVTSTDKYASVPVTVTEGASSTTSAKLVLNPDLTNPDLENPDFENPDQENPDIENAEAHAITVSNPDVENPDIENISKANPDIENPDLENPDQENPDLTNPDIVNPDLENPDQENPDLENPDLENPDLENPDLENAALTDVTWNVKNVGNTATSYQVKLLLKQAQQQRLMNAGVRFQLIVTKTTAAPVIDKCAVKQPNRNYTVVNVTSPPFVDPTNSQQFATVVTPDIENPDLENTTVALAPGDLARVTLRIYSPDGDTTANPNPTPETDPFEDLTGSLTDLKTLGVVTTSHPVDTLDVQQGSTTPTITASVPVIITTTLPDGVRAFSYTAALEQTGSARPFSYAVTTGATPPGITLHPDGTFSGAPTSSGVFSFTVTLTDAQSATSTATLILRVFEPVVVGGGSLADGIVNIPYSTTLVAAGGFPPYAWSFAGGSLPAGVSLAPSGVLAGTPSQSGAFTFSATATDSAQPPRLSTGSLLLEVSPTANAQSVTVAEDTATPITVSGNGAPQSSFTFAIGNQPAHGTLSGSGPTFTYTPASNYNGDDSFTFKVMQGTLSSGFATVTINVTATNDAPTATPKTVNTPQGIAIPITLTGTDPENNPLTFAIVTNPTPSGSLSLITGGNTVTYTPTAGFTGNATFTFRANDGLLNSTPATVTVIVGPPPANGTDVTLTLPNVTVALGATANLTATIHNSGPATATGAVFTLSYPSADLMLTSATPTQGSCTMAQPIVCTIGSMANGADVTVAIALRAFNHGGTFTTNGSVSVASLDYNTSNNAVVQTTTVTGSATASTDLSVAQARAPNPVTFGSNVVYTIVVTNNGPSDATGVSLVNTFTGATATYVSSTAIQGSCVNVASQVACNVGSLIGGASATYTVTLQASGSSSLSNTATVTGSQNDPTPANNTATLATTISNRTPTAVADVATVYEDGSVTIFVLANDTDPDNDTLTVTSANGPEHGSTQVVGGLSVTYSPDHDYFGSDSFSYTISDGHGGTTSASVNVSVLAVNDAPSFVKGANQSIGENAGGQTVINWATAISGGPVSENDQAVGFVVSNNNHFLFSEQPMVDAFGTLTYTVAPSGTGVATVTVTAVDDGGTANGGNDSSASQTFLISVAQTNDAPSFTKGADQVVDYNQPAQSVPSWATNISAGPPDENGQAVDFVVSNDNTAIFSQQPAVSPSGTLTYQTATNVAGAATVTVRAHDDGGTTPGVDTSAPQTFTITVNATGNATFIVTNTSDAGNGSLRAAITNANATPFNDTIAFAIATGSAPFTIQPLSALPPIVNPVGIDATTQPGFAGTPIVELSGASAGGGANGLVLDGQAANSSVRGMIINRFTDRGISVKVNGVVIAGNYIGTDAAGTGAAGNGAAGVFVESANGAVVGGAVIADRNIIAFNAGPGVGVQPGSANRISQNSIYNNGGLGIDLGAPDVLFNDPGDFDIGANGLQNHPVLTSAVINSGVATVSGVLNSTPITTFAVELFSNQSADPSGFGEGRTYLQTVSVVTDGAGNAPFTTAVPWAGGTFVTATATDPAGNTSEFSLARLVINNSPPTATNDSMTAIGSTTTYPGANDTDPDVASPSILATYNAWPPASPFLAFPGDVAVVNATGLGYFTGGGLTVATPPTIGILDTATNTITGNITPPVRVASSLTRVNQTTKIVYMRTGPQVLQAIDGRPLSPTFNQAILSMQVGTINAMAIDEGRGRLYMTVTTNVTGSIQLARLLALDVDPASQTFHQVVNEITAPNNPPSIATANSVAVNTVTNKIYVGVSGGQAAGVNVIDGTNFSASTIASTSLGGSTVPITLVVNSANNMIYATQGNTLFAIDGNTNTRLAAITLPASASNGVIDSRLAVHEASGHVYVRVAQFPSESGLVVVDGDRASPNFNTILTTITGLGREDNQTITMIDETANRLIVTSKTDLKSVVINTSTNAIVNTIQATQPVQRATIDTVHHRAYVVGGAGYIQAINLVTGALVGNIATGVEAFSGAVNPVSHQMYLPTTALTVGLQRVGASGFLGTVPGLPNGDGRASNVIRNPVTNRFYFVNANGSAAGGSDALPGYMAVIDGSTNAVIDAGDVINFPFQGVAVNESTNTIYVGGAPDGPAFSGGITVVDGVTHDTQSVNLSAIPQNSPTPDQLSFQRDMVVNPITNKVYARITAGSPAPLAVINGATNIATAMPNTFGTINVLRVNPLLNRIYIGGTDNANVNQIHVLDGNTENEIATLNVGSATPYSTVQQYLAVDRTHNRLFAADFNGDVVSVVNATNNTVTSTITVGDGPSGVYVNESANRIYVANTIARTVTIIDGATLRVTNTIAMPIAPHRVDADETLNRIYVTGVANEPGVVVIQDPLTSAPPITSVTQGAHGSVTLNADGSVTYAPTGPYTGPDTYTYTVSDGLGGSSTATVNVTVVGPLTITTASLPNTTTGQGYSQTLAATGGTGTKTWTVTSGLLPGGITLNNVAGTLTGTAQQSGTFSFTISVRDSGNPQQVASQAYVVSVGPPVITTLTVSNPFAGTPYNQQISVGGATGAVTWSLSTANNPALSWLSISSTGVLQGTPTLASAMPPFTVTATDSLNQAASRQYTVTVNGPLDIGTLREGVVLESINLVLIGGSGLRTTTLTTGTLPPGLSLLSTGFSGTPTRPGTYNFTVLLEDCQPSNGLPTCSNTITPQSISKDLTLRVSAKDQQGNQGGGGSISFGGPGGRRLAQTFTVGAQGTLTGIGVQQITCPSATPLSVEVQRLGFAGKPDGITIASGLTANTGAYQAIPISPPVDVAIGDRLAYVVSSPVSCTFNNTSNVETYHAGDAFTDSGSGWASLFSTDSRYDLPSFRTLIQPAMNVGYLNTTHNNYNGVTLANGKILFASGGGNASAEIYDPATNISTPTGSLSISRNNGATVLLTGTGDASVDGTVLVVGGRDPSSVRLATAETFDPSTATWTPTANNLSVGRDNLRAVMLNNGKVLITGGSSSSSTVANADLYDPLTRTFSSLPNMLIGRQSHVAILLNSGKVLLAGGFTSGSGPSAEVFDPGTNSFTATNNAMIVTNRGGAAAALLLDGRVLVTGGQNGDVRNETEIYDPTVNPNGTFSAAPNMTSKRYLHQATTLPDGSVLISGGYDQGPVSSYVLPLSTLERYVLPNGPDPASFVPAGSMETRRQAHSAVTAGGKVYLGGGFSQSWMTGNTVDIYDPAGALTITPTTIADASPNVAITPVVFSVAGGTGPYSIALGGGTLPQGLTFVPATKTLSGTPGPGVGTYNFSLTATDDASHVVVQSFTIRVGTVNTITTAYRLIDGAQGAAYSMQFAATGQSPITWTVQPASGSLPSGLTLTTGGLITGTPTVTGFFTINVKAVDNLGMEATKTHAISINTAMQITTTSLADGTLFSSYFPCVNTVSGLFPRTFSISAGSLPPGLSINSGNGCFTGQIGALGNFSFTVQVADSSSPPQVKTQPLSINVALLTDQNGSWDSNQPAIGFGSGQPVAQVAERVLTGVSGLLSGTRISGNSICPNGTILTAEVRGVAPNGGPDGNVIASGSAAYVGSFDYIPLSPQIFFAADQPFTLVFGANAACSIRPSSFDSYPGEGYVGSSGSFARLHDSDPRYDIGFQTLVQPQPLTAYGFMKSSRAFQTATLLANGAPATNGKVLLVSDSTAELYDPATNTFTSTPNPNVNRTRHTATLLNDGTVLVTGGSTFTCNPTCTTTYQSSAELYHPDTNSWELLSNAMTTPRSQHTATKLPDGKVLLVGGFIGGTFPNSYVQTAEIYDPDPAHQTFTATVGSMAGRRSQHTATLLNGGLEVLVAGGFGSYNSTQAAEIYDIAAGTFSNTTGTMRVTFRASHTATLLNSGKVLLVGGSGSSSASSETYDPGDGTFTAEVGPLTPRDGHAATLLNDGSVLITGGFNDSTGCCSPYPPTARNERYTTSGFVGYNHAGAMQVERWGHAATLLANGKVLITGSTGWSSSAGRLSEIYDPATALTFTYLTLASGSVGNQYPDFTFEGQGGSGGPYSVQLVSGQVPPGMTYDQPTRTLAGTPTQSGPYSMSFKLMDNGGHSLTQAFTLRIDELTILTGSFPPGYVGQAVAGWGLSAIGVGSISWSIVNGSLPPGLSFTPSNGAVTGTPTTTGFYPVTFRALDSIGQDAYKQITIQISNPLTINTTSLRDGLTAETYGGCINYSNGVFPLTWSLGGGGQIPPGMAINSNNGCFDTTWPDRVVRLGGTYNLYVNVSDSSVPAQTKTRNFFIRMFGQDQLPSTDFQATNVPLPASRRIAQVFQAGTPFGLGGVQLWTITQCTAGTVITANAWPVTGTPARPDESGAPLATANITIGAGGLTDNLLPFTNVVPMPQGAQFAMVVSFASGSCEGQWWPTSDWYPQGQGWIDDGSGWQTSKSAIGRPDVSLFTFTLPDAGLEYTPMWRSNPASVTLPNGRILIIGDETTPEVYNPSATAGQKLTVTGPMGQVRRDATATLLTQGANAGKVLVIGGTAWNGTQSAGLATTELYNPSTNTFSAGPNLPESRFQHRATMLANGKILITGGRTMDINNNWIGATNALLLDEGGTLVATLGTSGGRTNHTATLLTVGPDAGKVLIAGGYGTGSPGWISAEIYDPTIGTNGSIQPAGNMNLWNGDHTATELTTGPNAGKVLIAGGGGFFPDLRLQSELYDPGTNSFSFTTGLLQPRTNHAAVKLSDGRIAFIGGQNDGQEWNFKTANVELFNPVTMTSQSAGDLLVDRSNPAAEVIGTSGNIVVIGGYSTSRSAPTAVEVFNATSGNLRLTAKNLPDGVLNATYAGTSFTGVGGSGGGYSYQLAWGNLPSGMSIGSNGLLTGTPTEGGVFPFVVRVTDSGSHTAYQTFRLFVNRLVITSNPGLPNGNQNQNYATQLTATGVGAITWSLEPFSTLPGTLALGSGGLLSGTLGAPGNYYFTIRATDSVGQSTVKYFSLFVN